MVQSELMLNFPFEVDTNWKNENFSNEKLIQSIFLNENIKQKNNIQLSTSNKEKCKISLTLKESNLNFFITQEIKIISSAKTIELYSGDDEYISTQQANEMDSNLFVCEFSNLSKRFKKITLKVRELIF
jgi:hypothetical protein